MRPYQADEDILEGGLTGLQVLETDAAFGKPVEKIGQAFLFGP